MCAQNVDDIVAECELDKEDACYQCKPPSIYFKTVFLGSNPNTLEEFRKELAVESTDGYCERSLQNMNHISNHNVCAGGKNNIAFQYKVTFSSDDTREISFKVPSDFGYGGYSLMDGEVMKEYRKDMWKKDPLAFKTTVD